MKEFIYRFFRKLYFKGLVPMAVWSPIYDRLHRQVKDQWR